MFCGNCGKQIPDIAVFCPLCGKRADGTDSIPEPALSPEPEAAPVVKPKKAKKKKKTGLIVLIAALVVVAALAVGAVLVLNDYKEKYADAEELLKDGEYQEAREAFQQIAVYKDSGRRADEAGYSGASELLEDKEYLDAQAAFAALGGYEDSAEQAEICGKLDICQNAQTLLDSGNPDDARALVLPIAGFAEADTIIGVCDNEIAYAAADQLLTDGRYQEARDAFSAISGFCDADEKAATCGSALDYEEALRLMGAGDMANAAVLLLPLSEQGFWDAQEQYTLCANWLAYYAAQDAYNAGKYYTAYTAFTDLGSFEDAAARAGQCIQTMPKMGAVYQNPSYTKKSVSLYVDNKNSSTPTYMKFYIGDTLVATMFVPAGEKGHIQLPNGTYTFKRAYGKRWFGTEEMFGADGTYYILDFSGESTYPLKGTGNNYYTLGTGQGGDPVDYNSQGMGDF